jgi:hypothetical protein
VPGGWHDPWDDDPQEAMVAALRQPCALRHLSEAGVQLGLVALPRADGRWEAHVVAGNGSEAGWPSVNGPTASRALDALEAELRELIRESVP